MKHSLAAAFALLAGPTVAWASELETFIFDYRSDMVCATGTLTGQREEEGWVSILDGELRVMTGANQGIYGLIGKPSGSSEVISPLGYFIYDNRIAPEATTPLNVYGLLFGSGGLEINIWGNGAGNAYTFYARSASAALSTGGDFTLSDIPSPAGIALACLGLCTAVIRRRRA